MSDDGYIYMEFRKDFDAEREKELADFEKSRPPMGSHHQNNNSNGGEM